MESSSESSFNKCNTRMKQKALPSATGFFRKSQRNKFLVRARPRSSNEKPINNMGNDLPENSDYNVTGFSHRLLTKNCRLLS